jgi:peptidyl-prolyl cis-trans isomerase B (cyclophilin B)
MATTTREPLPDVGEFREGLVQRLERWRVPILAGFAVAVLGSLGAFAWSAVRREKVEALRTEMHGILDDFTGGRSLYSFGAPDFDGDADLAKEQAAKLEELRLRAAGTEIEPHLLLHLAFRYQVMKEDAKVLALTDELRTKFADSPVARLRSYDSDRSSLVDRVAATSKRRLEFGKDRKVVVPAPDPSVFALVETDLGAMKIVFWPDLAPKHVAAFLEQAKKGAFNGTRCYLARRGEVIELGGGDRTRNDDPLDDRNDLPSLALAPEDEARLYVKHRRRTVTSVRLLSGDQSDRFAVVLSETKPEYDAVNTPFGELLDEASAAVADRLGSTLVYGEDAAFVTDPKKTSHPYTPSRPVIVRRVSIWKEGSLDAGHAWDTARVGTEESEPESPKEKEGAESPKEKEETPK